MESSLRWDGVVAAVVGLVVAACDVGAPEVVFDEPSPSPGVGDHGLAEGDELEPVTGPPPAAFSL